MNKFKTTNQILVPKHEIMPKEDKEKLLKKFNISEEQLPKILVSDSVIKEIGGKPGDLIKITRNSNVAGKSLYYRLVISD